MKSIVFECKTPGCAALLKAGELPDDTFSTIHFVVEVKSEPIRLRCPDCGQDHDYVPNEHKLTGRMKR